LPGNVYGGKVVLIYYFLLKLLIEWQNKGKYILKVALGFSDFLILPFLLGIK